MGASSAGASSDITEKFREFGENCGLAFQLKDDLLDYGQGDIGKPKGIDIRERKMTLPLIFALNHASHDDRRFMIQTVKNYNTDRKRVARVMEMVKEVGGITYAQNKMESYRDIALNQLAKLGHGSDYDMMDMLVKLLTDREK